jgi:uncharacterized surface protein with fasciclin (FAS1) repeats
MKRIKLFAFALIASISSGSIAQTNLFDNVIAVSPNHNYLEAALLQEGLASALQDPTANLTVFAPDDQAFEQLAAALQTDIAGLLALDNLSDILLYHVLGTAVPSSAVTNGAIVQPLSNSNTLKLTLTGSGNVFVNHAQVVTPDLTTDNGIAHSINAVLLPVQTVVDVALNNGFTTLATAVITAELLPALSNPLATLTVFAPTNEAFAAIAGALGTDINGLLALPNLADVLTYHVLGTEVPSSAVTNGAIVQPLSTLNTLKLTVTSTGTVFVNQAQVTLADVDADNGVVHVIDAVVLPAETVVDVAIDNGFSTLATAVITAELLPALSNPLATYTVFAPTNEAFSILAASLGTDIAGLLNLPNLADVLLYHVLGSEVASSAVTNGAIVQPLSNTNTLKLTLSGAGNVFVNHAQVTLADVSADNGLVHVINAVLLPVETVVDVALDNGFTYLATAVITAELLPALTSPLTVYSVFAPTNEAFSSLASALGTDINGLLALPNLADVLTYHVIAGLAPSTSLTNGVIVQPISSSNTLKITVTSTGSVFVNQAQVTLADVTAYNGLVHVINEVVLPVETVVDVAIDNGFSTLTTAVIQEELVPVLSNPLASFTVFAPTNEAFDNLATALGTDINGILALPNLTDVLTYHVLGSEVLSTELTAGPVNTVNGAAVTVSLTNGVMINNANVTLADVLAYNGVVHVIDAVLLPIDTQVDQFSNEQLTLYPNPVQDVLTINGEVLNYSIMDQQGRLVQKGGLMSNKTIDFGGMESGIYFLQLQSASGMSNHKVVKN